MNREECIKEYGLSAGTKALTNLIYSEFESRTCGNCKQDGNLCTYQESIKVYCKVTRGEDYVCDFRDFGCNRFERKKEK